MREREGERERERERKGREKMTQSCSEGHMI